MQADLKAGDIQQLSIRVASKRYGVGAQLCRELQNELRKQGLLERRGNQFFSVEAAGTVTGGA